PSLITWIVKLAVWPLTIVWESGVFEIEMCGLITSTSAESCAVTSWSVSSVPVATAVLVKSEVTFASEHVYDTLSPGAKVLLLCGGISAISAAVRAQPGAWASVTCTSVRVESPVLVTVIVQLAVSPFRIVCESGFLLIEMCGLITSRTSSWQPLEAGLLLSSPEYQARQ